MSIENIKEQWERLSDEMENFQEMARFLNPSPGEIPDLEGVDISGLSMPMRDVLGGDHILYIDFRHRYDLDTRIAEAKQAGQTEVEANLKSLFRRVGILVADVSGHRMTDAFIAAMLHQAFLLGVIYELDRSGEITTRLFEHINTRFYRTTATNKFFTMIYGEISRGGKFRFLSAGHTPPAIYSREFQRFMRISPDRLVSFPPVGLLPSGPEMDDVDPEMDRYKKRYEVNEINLLNVGDIVLLHSDGLSEHAGGNYFPERVEKLLSEAGDITAAEICARLREDILAAAPPEDDISVVVIRRTR